jgi:hypothetical protein
VSFLQWDIQRNNGWFLIAKCYLTQKLDRDNELSRSMIVLQIFVQIILVENKLLNIGIFIPGDDDLDRIVTVPILVEVFFADDLHHDMYPLPPL